MPFPSGQKVIDLMMAIPVSEDNAEWYEAFKPLLRDTESRAMFKMPAQYMFKDIPKAGPVEDKLAWTLSNMDKFNIARAMIGFDERAEGTMAAHAKFRDRFFFDLPVDPNDGMDEVKRIRAMKRKYNIDAVSVFPAGVNPQVPINDKRFYPIYTVCSEENLPIFVNTGVPGPRVPMACQDVHLVDEVCWFFPDLKFVMRHGAEPHVAMAVKLMLKYPNLYYSTSAFAPKYYPPEIITFANSRGADKILYAGYFPMGLSLERIFKELAAVPFNDNVWPKFLYENALKVLGAAN